MELYVGKRLFTKDGRKVGNGIIVAMMPDRFGGPDVYEVDTDFGNIMRLNLAELDSLYHLFWEPDPEIQDPLRPHSLETWRADRLENAARYLREEK